MKEEIWRDVVGYKGCYQVSDLGNIRSLDRIDYTGRRLKGRILKPAIACGYLVVNLSLNGKVKTLKVHQLVAITFLNHKPCGHKLVIDHIDNNKLNNSLENLQIITQRENSSKDRVGGSSIYTGVSFHPDGNKYVARCFHNSVDVYLGRFNTELEASEAYNNYLKTIK